MRAIILICTPKIRHFTVRGDISRFVRAKAKNFGLCKQARIHLRCRGSELTWTEKDPRIHPDQPNARSRIAAHRGTRSDQTIQKSITDISYKKRCFLTPIPTPTAIFYGFFSHEKFTESSSKRNCTNGLDGYDGLKSLLLRQEKLPKSRDFGAFTCFLSAFGIQKMQLHDYCPFPDCSNSGMRPRLPFQDLFFIFQWIVPG